MRIALLAPLQRPLRSPFPGEVERLCHGLAMGLREAGHEVRLYAHADSDPALPLARGLPGLFQRDLSARETDEPAQRRAAFLSEALAWQWVVRDLMRAGEVDVIHSHTANPAPLLQQALFCAPMVTTLYGRPGGGWAREALCLLPPQERGHLVVPSASHAAGWRADLGRLSVILPGVDTLATPPAPQADRLIWSGGIEPEAGLHLAIDAARRARVPLEFAGPISDRFYFADYIEPRLGEGVRYRGHLCEERRAAWMAGAAVALVTPCGEAGAGLSALDALACGVPVAGFARGGLAELLCPRTGILVPAGDVSSLAGVLSAVVGMDRAACRQRAAEHFSWERYIDDHVRLYESLLAEPVQGRVLQFPGTEARRPERLVLVTDR